MSSLRINWGESERPLVAQTLDAQMFGGGASSMPEARLDPENTRIGGIEPRDRMLIREYDKF
jgi:hypothetical protein